MDATVTLPIAVSTCAVSHHAERVRGLLTPVIGAEAERPAVLWDDGLPVLTGGGSRQLVFRRLRRRASLAYRQRCSAECRVREVSIDGPLSALEKYRGGDIRHGHYVESICRF